MEKFGDRGRLKDTYAARNQQRSEKELSADSFSMWASKAGYAINASRKRKGKSPII